MTRRLLAVVLGICALVRPASAQTPPTMTLHFIDVGQGLSTLVEFPCGAMLIDAGADIHRSFAVMNYLNTFFQRRIDLNRTLDLVLITHNHIDHDSELQKVVEGFTVKRYIDDGILTAKGGISPTWLRGAISAGQQHLTLRVINQTQVAAVAGRKGLTNSVIDPFDCGQVDPEIRILNGRRMTNPGWPAAMFKNPNNHSLVTRIDFGQSSALFLGDLMEHGITSLLNFYTGPSQAVLHTDVMQVGHHGSHNATTTALLAAIRPRAAVISVGECTFGLANHGEAQGFNTAAYGHPRKVAIDRLEAAISDNRAQPQKGAVADAVFKFHEQTITKSIYSTSWDGAIRIAMDTTGKMTVDHTENKSVPAACTQ